MNIFFFLIFILIKSVRFLFNILCCLFLALSMPTCIIVIHHLSSFQASNTISKLLQHAKVPFDFPDIMSLICPDWPNATCRVISDNFCILSKDEWSLSQLTGMIYSTWVIIACFHGSGTSNAQAKEKIESCTFELRLTYMGVLTQHNYDKQHHYSISIAPCAVQFSYISVQYQLGKCLPQVKKRSNNLPLKSIAILLFIVHAVPK